MRLVRRGARPAGLGARDTLRLEVCFHLYGNDLSVERGPIEAGLGWCCKEDTGFIGARGRGARCARAARARSSSRSPSTVPGSRARATPCWAAARSPAARSRRAWASASAWPTCPPSAPPPGPALEIDVRGKMRPAVVKEKPLYRKGS